MAEPSAAVSAPPLSRRRVVTVSSRLAQTIFCGFAVMQIGIAAGVVPVTIVWGGSQHELTTGLRLASVFAAVLLLAFAWVIRTRADDHHADGESGRWIRVASWIVTAYMILNTAGNLASSNVVERLVSSPLTAILAVCCGIVSSSKGATERTGGYTEIDA